MILINKNTSQSVHLTLNEKSQYVQLGVQPYFLFVFTNQNNTDNVIKFTTEDSSTLPDRYNKFRIVEDGSSIDLLNGYIYMTGNTSQWSYEVYEASVPFSADTLDIQYTTGKILEKGRVQLIGNDTYINDIYK